MGCPQIAQINADEKNLRESAKSADPGWPGQITAQTPHWTLSRFYSNFRVVANAAKTTGQNPPAKTGTVSFEEALKKLESIVESMESGDLPLETLLAKYEEGTKLARMCQTKLAEAELKIVQLEKTGAGELQLKPAPELSEE
jgi:exodeoxyribonuclease VII small subunit